MKLNDNNKSINNKSIGDYLNDTIKKELDTVSSKVQRRLNDQSDLIHELQKEIEAVKNEKYKDEELQRMQAFVKEARQSLACGFPISKEENAAVRAWQEKHIKNRHGGNHYAGAIGGRFSYEFIPTSIGIIATCKCATCSHNVEKLLGDSVDSKRRSELVKEYDSEFDFRDLM